MGVSAHCVEDEPQARSQAQRLGLSLLPTGSDPKTLDAGALLLTVENGRSQLRATGPRAPGPVSVDFHDPALRHRRRGGQNELLGRAVGWRKDRAPTVLDATAGFGRDAYVLADLGCRLYLCERQPLIAMLLHEALARAAAGGGEVAAAAARMQLFPGDARELDPASIDAATVIYLDPMFVAARRAAPGKAMQLLHQLLDTSTVVADDATLLAWALAQPVERVVVKRARRAPVLPGPAPGHSLSGRSVRFDVYPVRRS